MYIRYIDIHTCVCVCVYIFQIGTQIGIVQISSKIKLKIPKPFQCYYKNLMDHLKLLVYPTFFYLTHKELPHH